MSNYTNSFGKTKFYVNKNNNTVTCVIDGTAFAAKDFLRNKGFWIPMSLFKSLNMPNRFVGVATCSENDIFDEEYGKRLAYHRAYTKLARCLFKRFNTFINEANDKLEQCVDVVNSLGERFSNRIEHENKFFHEEGE